MPPMYRHLYPNCRCIIDCLEIFTETPRSFEARKDLLKLYMKHNMVKFLIGISPCGAISFLSQCWSDHVSDKHLTQQSGFLNLIDPGDLILADRGLYIEEDITL